jgi:hypothetical protein
VYNFAGEILALVFRKMSRQALLFLAEPEQFVGFENGNYWIPIDGEIKQ